MRSRSRSRRTPAGHDEREGDVWWTRAAEQALGHQVFRVSEPADVRFAARICPFSPRLRTSMNMFPCACLEIVAVALVHSRGACHLDPTPQKAAKIHVQKCQSVDLAILCL